MVRTYKHKTSRADIDETIVARALTEISNGRMSLRTAASEFGLKKSMLHKRFKKQRNTTEDSGAESDTVDQGKSKYASNQVFSAEEENMLNSYLLKSSSIHYGLTLRQTRTLAYEYALKLNKKFPNKWNVEKQAGIDWMKSFLKRHKNISLRKPENTSLARATSFNPANVNAFFCNHKSVLEKFKFEPNRILNLDETGITTVLPSPKVLIEKGKKQVGQIVSSERGQLVTFVGIITATGNALPPIYVFPRVHAKDHFVNGGPIGAVGLAHKSGWMTAELFMNVLKHIVHHLSPSKENPILLLIDNHKSHISLPALLQPLDVGVYGPFKAILKSTFNNHMATHPGKQITIYDIPQLSKQPFLLSFIPKNITKAFEATGLWPLNELVFTEADFQSSYVSDRPVTDSVVNSNLSNTGTTGQNATRPENKSVLDERDTTPPGPSGIVTPEVLRPYPKAAPRRNVQRRTGKSCIYTSTPEMDAIKNKEQERQIPKEKKRNVKRVIFESSPDKEHMDAEDSSEEGGSFSDEGFDGNDFAEEHSILDSDVISTDDFVLVKFATKKTFIYYVALVQKLFEGGVECEVKYLRRKLPGWSFHFPVISDIATVIRDDIVLKLPKPVNHKGTARTSDYFKFGVDLT
ncbi:hypothetical protein PPYR_15448, partial [Photinus pyralis]